MPRVYFLVNDLSEYTFGPHVERELAGVEVTVGNTVPAPDHGYDLVVPWNYRRIIKGVSQIPNVVVFHSSELPAGKGWAPLYNTIARGQEYYHITGIVAAEEVDAGDVVARARFRMRPSYTAGYLRKWNEELQVRLAKGVLDRFRGRRVEGVKQSGESTFYPRRRPEDNQLSLDATIGSVITHLRACERQHPAFVVHDGVKFLLHLEPAEPPEFPTDLEITYYP